MNKKIKKVFLFTLILILGMQIKGYAAERENMPSFEVELKAEKQVFHVGDEFEIEVKIANLRNIEKGLMAISGQIEYDKEKLEKLSIEGRNSWDFDGNSLNEKNLKFLIDCNTYTKTEQTIVTIKFKVKKNNNDSKDSWISIQNVVASNGKEDITAKDVKLTVSLENKEEIKPPDNENNNDNNNNNNQVPDTNTIPEQNQQTNEIVVNNVTNILSNRVNTVEVVDSIANTPIPRTGIQDWVITMIIGVGLISIVCYIRSKMLEKKENEE